MPATPTLLAGRYRLGESLGRGGMGQVWLARDETLDRDVAIKEISPPDELIAEDREVVQRRTLREARAAARLNHPHVVQVYDVLESDGRTWIVMEHVPSRSLQEVITRDGPLDDALAARIGLDLLTALEAAHRAGVWHRDVKPANVLLGDDGRVVLSDFGIATIEGDSLVTGSGLVVGSPEYMPPERARDGVTGPAADLWSLGATLYAAVEGRSPYRRGSVLGTLTALAAEEPDPPHRATALRPVLDGLLRTDPTARTDFAETRRRLRAAAGDEPGEPGGTPTPADRPVPAQRRPAPPVALPAPPPDAAAPDGAPAAGTAPGSAPAAGTEPGGSAPAPPTPARGRRRTRRLLVAAIVLALAAAGVGWFTLRPDPGPTARETPAGVPGGGQGGTPGGTPGGAPGGTTPSASAAAGAPPPGASAAAPAPSGAAPAAPADPRDAPRPALRAGWRDHKDRTGFSVYVPAGWRESRKGSMVYFRDPRGGRVLGIDQTDRPKADPVADWRGQAAYRVDRGDFPGYDEIRIEPVRYWRKAADWEFTFDGGNRRHVNNRGVVVSKKRAYGIYWQTSHAAWDENRDELQLIFDSFRPGRG